ncbi:MAG: LysM peptidoglycan-binding domain-containing protein [Francisellaceae bacterium]
MKKNLLALLAVTVILTGCASTKMVYLTPDQYCETPTLSQYTVKKGDNLFTIAKANNTTPACIKQLNHLKGDVINPDQKLYLPDVKTSAD